MYTRFKTKKNGINIGMMTTVNGPSTRARVVAAPSNSQIVANNNSDCNTNTDLSSSSSSSLSSSTVNLNNNINSNEYLIIADPFSDCVSEEKSIKTSNKSKKAASQIVKSEEVVTVIKTKNPKKPAKNSKQENEDTSDINYVQSTWEEYSYQIGTQDGPLRYEINENEHPHLEGFVAFDLEYWWAERSMSSMINEKSNQISTNTADTNSYNILKSIIKNNYDINNNELSAMKIASLLISSAKPKTSLLLYSSMQMNNLQEIYS